MISTVENWYGQNRTGRTAKSGLVIHYYIYIFHNSTCTCNSILSKVADLADLISVSFSGAYIYTYEKGSLHNKVVASLSAK